MESLISGSQEEQAPCLKRDVRKPFLTDYMELRGNSQMLDTGTMERCVAGERWKEKAKDHLRLAVVYLCLRGVLEPSRPVRAEFGLRGSVRYAAAEEFLVQQGTRVRCLWYTVEFLCVRSTRWEISLKFYLAHKGYLRPLTSVAQSYISSRTGSCVSIRKGSRAKAPN